MTTTHQHSKSFHSSKRFIKLIIIPLAVLVGTSAGCTTTAEHHSADQQNTDSTSVSSSADAGATRPTLDMKEKHNEFVTLYSKKLAVSIMPTFKRVFENGDDRTYQVELIPENQTTDNWTDMITILGSKGLGKVKGLTLERYMKALFSISAQGCRNDHVRSDIGSFKLQGNDRKYDGRMFLSGCKNIEVSNNPKVPVGVSEIALYIIIDGGDDFYSVFYSVRGKSGTVPFNENNIKNYMLSIMPVRVCEKTMTDQECVRDVRPYMSTAASINSPLPQGEG